MARAHLFEPHFFFCIRCNSGESSVYLDASDLGLLARSARGQQALQEPISSVKMGPPSAEVSGRWRDSCSWVQPPVTLLAHKLGSGKRVLEAGRLGGRTGPSSLPDFHCGLAGPALPAPSVRLWTKRARCCKARRTVIGENT